MEKSQIFFALLFAIIAVGFYWISKPLPNFEDAWKYRLLSLTFVNGRRLARLASWWTGRAVLDIERDVLSKHGDIQNRHGVFRTVKKTIEGVPVNIYYPSSDVKKEVDSKGNLYPGIIYIHGGGFVYPSAGHEDACIDYSMAVNAIVISVDYRLSPEHPCPAAPDDVYFVTKHVLQNANKYGLDSKRIIIMGDSAGGNLAATTSLRLAKIDPHIDQPKFQILIIPGLQFFSLNLSSYQDEIKYPEFLSTQLVAWFGSTYLAGHRNFTEVLLSGNHTKHLQNTIYASYLGLAPEGNYELLDYKSVDSPILPKIILENLLNPFYFPLMAHDLTGVPPAYVITCEYDVLKNDGELYVSRLRNAGVSVTHKHYHGFHGINLFYNASKLPFPFKAAIEMNTDLTNFIKENL